MQSFRCWPKSLMAPEINNRTLNKWDSLLKGDVNMIYTTLDQLSRYLGLSKNMDTAIRHALENDLSQLKPQSSSRTLISSGIARVG